MTGNLQDWKKIADHLHDVLPMIDDALSQANIAISSRPPKAFDLVRETMLEISDYKAFLVSEAHGRFHIIIGEWYRSRYGEAVDDREDTSFATVVVVHRTPFPMHVPKNFRTDAEEPDMAWIAFPASVQEEEDALEWIDSA